ncbi:MAG: glucosamine-6-phosphate deaminase [Agriterribacter sp.]
MQLMIFENNDALSREAARHIIDTVKQKPDAVLCMASGSTPILTYAYVVETALREKIDLSNISFIGLDEWLGIPPDNEGSCHYFFQHHLFQHISFNTANIHLFDALAKNPSEECKKMDAAIAAKGGIDLMLVGIGMNGHIGFNEPGVAFNKYSHIVDLDETTVSVGQKYFKETTVLKQGITLGLQHLMESKKVLLLANREKKASIIRQTMEGEISNKIPASIMRQHTNGIIMLDKEAASLIKY